MRLPGKALAASAVLAALLAPAAASADTVTTLADSGAGLAALGDRRRRAPSPSLRPLGHDPARQRAAIDKNLTIDGPRTRRIADLRRATHARPPRDRSGRRGRDRRPDDPRRPGRMARRPAGRGVLVRRRRRALRLERVAVGRQRRRQHRASFRSAAGSPWSAGELELIDSTVAGNRAHRRWRRRRVRRHARDVRDHRTRRSPATSAAVGAGVVSRHARARSEPPRSPATNDCRSRTGASRPPDRRSWRSRARW